jgi:UPF0716 family protein affecting phage T7 exclusion
MRLLAHRPVRRRRHRELFVLAAVLFVLGGFVLDGLGALALFASILVFFLGILHRLSGEDTRAAERGNMIGFGG